MIGSNADPNLQTIKMRRKVSYFILKIHHRMSVQAMNYSRKNLLLFYEITNLYYIVS